MICRMAAEFMNVEWPAGPAYYDWVGEGSDSPRAWTRYKLRSAAWYVDILERLCSAYGFERLAGVEMAVDGALASLSSAFDASVATVIRACEEQLKADASATGAPAPVPIEPWLYSWGRARRRYSELAGQGLLPDAVTSAWGSLEQLVNLALSRDAPVGWLESLRRLRNRATHQNTLSRHIDLVVGDDERTTWELVVDGRPEEPVGYLRATSEDVRNLTNKMLDVAHSIAPHGMGVTRLTDSQSVTALAPPASASARVPVPELQIGSHTRVERAEDRPAASEASGDTDRR